MTIPHIDIHAAGRLLLLVAIPVAGLWYAELRRSEGDLPAGVRVPDISTLHLSGPVISPGPTAHPTFIVAFTATCPFCREELARCADLAIRYHGRIDVRAVSFSDRRTTSDLLGDSARPFTVESIANPEARHVWKISRVPTMMLTDIRGILVARWTGVKSPDEEMELLDRASVNIAGHNR